MQPQMIVLCLVGLGGMSALAAPSSTILRRQNDTPQCVDGVDGPPDAWDASM